MDKENNNDPLKIWGLYLFVLAFPGECVNQLGSEVKSILRGQLGDLKHWTCDTVWCCVIEKKFFFIDMKFGINQAISQTITQLSCIQLETPSSRLWNFWWIKTYTTFKFNFHQDVWSVHEWMNMSFCLSSILLIRTCACCFKLVIFKLASKIDMLNISYEIF